MREHELYEHNVLENMRKYESLKVLNIVGEKFYAHITQIFQR